VSRGRAKIGALFKSSSFVPLNPTRRWLALNSGIQLNSRPASKEAGFSE